MKLCTKCNVNPRAKGSKSNCRPCLNAYDRQRVIRERGLPLTDTQRFAYCKAWI